MSPFSICRLYGDRQMPAKGTQYPTLTLEAGDLLHALSYGHMAFGEPVTGTDEDKLITF